MSKELIIIIIAILALVIITFLLIIPAWDSLAALGVTIDLKKEELVETQALAQKIDELEKKYEANIQDIEKLTSVLPIEKDLPGLLVQMENLAISNNLLMDSIGFAEVQQAQSLAAPMPEEDAGPSGEMESTAVSETPISSKSYKVLQLTMSLKGNYESFKKYLEAVEKNLRLTDVTAFNFAAGGESNLSFKISAKVYFQ